MSQNIQQIILDIDGMTCTGCETRIENVLKKLDGIVEVKAIFSNSKVYITYDADKLEYTKIAESIERLDYRIKGKSQSFSEEAEGNGEDPGTDTVKKTNIIQMIGIGVIIMALYMIIKNTVGFNFIPEINQSMGYGLLFAVGLLTSLHCVAMCGGINLSVCMQYKTAADSDSKFAKLVPSALYNLGRVISYTVVGGIVGALGRVVSFSGATKGIIAVISGVFMVIMGLNMLNIFPWLRKLNPRLPKFLGRKVHSNANKKGPLVVGLLNGLMPCGPLQAMQLYALGTGSFAAGAFSMFLFSMGTVPLMFGFGALSSLISGKFTHRMMKVSAVLVMVLGVFMLYRGLNLSGLGISPSFAATDSSSVAKIDNGVQYVSMDLESGRYSPIIVQKGIPVKWTVNVEKGDLNGCNNPLTIPEFNKQVKLKTGENIIEFTPEKEGDIIYTCWMGMISSRIRVVADINSVSSKDVEEAKNSSGNPLFGGIKAPPIPTDKIAVGEIRDGKQYVTINVKDNEISPAVVVLQENVETVWTINGVELNDHNKQLFFPQYNAVLNLQPEENILKLEPEFDFTFTCSTGTLNGYVKVVEDINKINIDDIKNEVKNYQPNFGGGAGGGASCH